MKSIIAIITAIFCLTSYGTVFSAESHSISGVVTESESNKPVSFVNLTITELSLSTLSNDKGEFSFSNIPAGVYHISTIRTGFKSSIKLVEVNSELTGIDIRIEKSLIETPVIDVTSSFAPVDIRNSTFSISSLSPRELTKQRSEILAGTIENIPGVNNFSTGSSLGKPVIRGLTSLGVIIVHDGVKHESQQWGDEHAPEISLYDLERIEILRGPASLVYGSDAIGGVVNIISKPLQYSTNKNGIFYGGIDLGGSSVNGQKTGNVSIGYGLSNWGIKSHIGYRSTGNTKTPDGTFPVNTLEPETKDTIHGGTLSNSGTDEIEGGAAIGVTGDFGHIDGGFEIFNRDIQMHDSDPDATANQKLRTNQFELSGQFNLKKNLILEPVLSYQQQARKEYESIEDKNSDLASLNLELKNFQGDLRLQHLLSKNVSGTAGVSFTSTENKTLGIEKLIPNYSSNSFGFYISEQFQFDKFTISAGARFDTKKLNIKSTVFESDSLGNTIKEVMPKKLNFDALSGSVGIVTHPSKNIDLFANLGRGWRAPSEFELFVDGEHEGTGRIERGLITLDSNANPNPESSWNIDFGIRANFKKFSASVSLFKNIINDFIYPSPAGIFDSSAMLPVFDIKQAKANFIGAEYTLQFHPFDFLLLSLNGDYVTAKNDGTGNYLPFIPPAKNILEIKFQDKQIGSSLYNPYISFSAKVVSAQTNTDPMETSTDGYTLFKAGFGFDFVLSKSIASLDFSIDNIADTKYVNHLSRYKTYALNPGRSFDLKFSMPFNF